MGESNNNAERLQPKGTSKQAPVDLDAYEEATLRLTLARSVADYLSGCEREPTGGLASPHIIADVAETIGTLIRDADRLLSETEQTQDKR